MLTINLVTETYDYDEDIDSPADWVINPYQVSFRELVSMMRDYAECSCSPASGAEFEWLSRSETDYRTGWTNVESIHYARENPARNLKFWRAAMRAAGFVK